MIPSRLVYLWCSHSFFMHQLLIECQVGVLTIYSKGEKKEYRQKKREGMGGCALGHFILSFSTGVIVQFDTETSLCSCPLGLEMSSRQVKWWSLIQISPPPPVSSSVPLLLFRWVRFLLLLLLLPAPSDFVDVKWDSEDSVHHRVLSVTFALSLNGRRGTFLTVSTHKCPNTRTHKHTHLTQRLNTLL